MVDTQIPENFDADEKLSSQASKVLTHNTEGEIPAFRNAGKITTVQNGSNIKVFVPLPFVHISELTYDRLDSILNAYNPEFIEVEVASCPET